MTTATAFSLARRLRAGETVHSGWCGLSSAIVAELVGREGFPAVTLDGQHGLWDTAATAVGHTDLPDWSRFVFEADQKPHTKWMYDVGSNLEFSRKFQLVADVGFDLDGGYLLVVGPTWRF